MPKAYTQLEELDDLDDLSTLKMSETGKSAIVDFYTGKSIFITGASGYVGTLLVEKLLRSCNTLKTLFLLFREGKNQSMHDKIEEYFNDEVFTRMKLENPNYSKQVRFMQGDLRSDNYGLTSDDQELLLQETNVIFHVAATVRFDERIRSAYEINVKGTRTIVSLAEQMKQLESFVYVSTAYSNNEQKHVEEKVYNPLFMESELFDLLQMSSDEEQAVLTTHILGCKVNTYTLTKSIAETIVRDKMESLPISIIRPSIILPTFREPIPIYYKGLSSLVAMSCGIGLGVLRTLQTSLSLKFDFVPGDKTTNALVAVGWYTANCNKQHDRLVFNYVSINDNPITMKQYTETTLSSLDEFKENNSVSLWKAHLWCVPNTLLYSILFYILHLLPCLFFVPLETRFKKNSQLLKIYRRIWVSRHIVRPFGINEWQFVNDNTKAVLERLNQVDKNLFDFDLSNFDWNDLLVFMSRSISRYTLKEQITRESYNNRMVYIDMFETVVVWLFSLGLPFFLCHVLVTLLNTSQTV